MIVFNERLDSIINEEYLFKITDERLTKEFLEVDGIYCFFEKHGNKYKLVRLGESDKLSSRFESHITSYFEDKKGSSFRNALFKDMLKEILKDNLSYAQFCNDYLNFTKKGYIRIFLNVQKDIEDLGKIDDKLNEYIANLHVLIFDFKKYKKIYNQLNKINMRNYDNNKNIEKRLRRFVELNLVNMFIHNNLELKDTIYNIDEIRSIDNANSDRKNELLEYNSKEMNELVDELINAALKNI